MNFFFIRLCSCFIFYVLKHHESVFIFQTTQQTSVRIGQEFFSQTDDPMFFLKAFFFFRNTECPHDMIFIYQYGTVLSSYLQITVFEFGYFVYFTSTNIYLASKCYNLIFFQNSRLNKYTEAVICPSSHLTVDQYCTAVVTLQTGAVHTPGPPRVQGIPARNPPDVDPLVSPVQAPR